MIAHEFSHIFNGDMRLNIRLIGVLYGILVISMTGWIIFRSTAMGTRTITGATTTGAARIPGRWSAWRCTCWVISGCSSAT